MTYGCHNRAPFDPSVSVQDGWETTWSRRMVDMSFRLNPNCIYSTSDLGKADANCSGCRWRINDDNRTPGPPVVADGTAIHGSIQGPLLEKGAGHSDGPGDVGPAKPADGGDAKALEQKYPNAAIYRRAE